MKSIVLAVIAAVVVIALGGMVFAAVTAPDPLDDNALGMAVSQVTVDDNRFGPRAIEVTPGTEVTWTFRDDTEHDVRAATFGSERMKKGTFTHTFADAGTYDYRCSLHSNMTGRVVVKFS